MDFVNVYEDEKRAESYARLEFPGTYYLAYRDIPRILEKYAAGKKALDFGCGTGRSTRFLKNLGFDAVGADISAGMIKKAQKSDSSGKYVLTAKSGIGIFESGYYDVITAVFTFDNIPGVKARTSLLKQLGGLLNKTGIIILVNSTPEIYINEWLSFSTKDFPENQKAKGGQKVKIIMTDVEDKRPVEDIIWFDNDYQNLFNKAGLGLIETHKPLGKPNEPYAWVNETNIAPWIIYVLKK
jgi:SAM-dependent methyltransferase